MDDEQFEHIPWEQLAPRQPDQRWPRLAYLVAGAIVVAALAAAVSRSIGRSPTETTEPTFSFETSSTTMTLPTIPAPQLYSEADLGALAPDEGMRKAAALAEWFVSDFFTADGSAQAGDEVRAHLPEGASLLLPQDAPEVRSFVEWAKAVEIEALQANEYRVIVVVRLLEAVGDAPYRRMPARAVAVVVQTNSEGATVADLPSPADLPQQIPAGPWPAPGDLPAAVAEAALEEAALWGSEPAVEAGALGADRWRVVVTIADPAGVRWPLVVWVEQ